jgi:hypothetical protein
VFPVREGNQRAGAPVHAPMPEDHSAEASEWIVAMRANDFARAWAINDRDLARRLAENAPKHEGPRHLQHIWRGEPLDGARVLVRCYHGLGDTLQFVRFAKPLRRIAREVILWVQPELLRLVASARGVDRVLPLHGGTPDVEYDVDIEVMELAFALRATREMIDDVPYLSPNCGTSRFTREPADRRIHIGLVWRAGDWDQRRSMDLRPFAQLDSDRVQLHLLQPTEVPSFRASDLSCPDIADVAATISQLDLVLTVDTMMAHLAGALGVPVWTMLCRDCDWRWGEGTTTPWYRTMRLFQQRELNNWQSVIAEIVDELRSVCQRTQERVRTAEVLETNVLTL